MHFAPGLRPGTPCSQSGYSRTLPTARTVRWPIFPWTTETPSLLGKNLCPSLAKRKNRHRSPAETVTHWAPFCPKLVKTVRKTMNRPEIPGLPDMLGHWFQWIQSGYMTYFRGKLKPSVAGKVAHWTSAHPKLSLLMKKWLFFWSIS